MKLIRWGQPGSERPGLIDRDGRVRDLSGHVSDITPDLLHPDSLDRLRGINPKLLPETPDGMRLGAPIANPRNLICIGLNYRDHAAEAGMQLPNEPVVFSKHSSALAGPFDPIRLPTGSVRSDWEVELAVIVGREAWQVTEDEALSYVAGYAVANDLSERDWQLERGGQWYKGKSFPGYLPLGPWLVTTDEVPNPQALRLSLTVNGQRMQSGSTADMVFPVAQLVSYLSRCMMLLPGDVICTGTPAGVGLGRGVFLKTGDQVEAAIAGLGAQSQKVVNAPSAPGVESPPQRV